MAWAAVDPDGNLAIGAAKAEHHLCKQIPGCNYRKDDGIWRLPLTWAGYVAFRTIWNSQPVEESPALSAWAGGAWEGIAERYRLRGQVDADEIVQREISEIEDGQPLGTSRALRPAQRGGVQWLAGFARVGLEDPTGNGKMIQCIRAVQLVRQRGDTDPVLVICPGAAIFDWRDRLADWAPELSVQTVTGTALRRRRALEEKADVYVIAWPNVRLHTRLSPYPGLAFTRCIEHGGDDPRVSPARCEVHPKEMNDMPWGIVIADESHRMRDARSKQTRAVWNLAAEAPYFWPCTGTPIGKNIGDLWPTLHAIDPLAHPSRSRYLDLYAIKQHNWHGGDEILGIRPDTERAYHAISQPWMRRIPREIARPGEPPRLADEFRYPEMSPEQKRLYTELRKELMAELEGETIVPANGGVKFARLCQLAGSSIELADGEDKWGFTTQVVNLALPSSKADDLLEFLDDTEGQLVVAANSPPLIELCERKLADRRIPHCKIIGGMTDEDKHLAKTWFQEGRCRVIFITAAGAEAITLTAASTIYFLQPDPTFLGRSQKIGRIDRIGQSAEVRVVNVITPGTVEERLYKLGLEKENRASQVTRDPDLLRWIVGGFGQDG